MTLQLIIVVALVAIAACYLGARGLKIFANNKKDCGGGCGCAGSQPKTLKDNIIPSSQLKIRRR